jgi:hypothetical protein
MLAWPNVHSAKRSLGRTFARPNFRSAADFSDPDLIFLIVSLFFTFNRAKNKILKHENTQRPTYIIQKSL